MRTILITMVFVLFASGANAEPHKTIVSLRHALSGRDLAALSELVVQFNDKEAAHGGQVVLESVTPPTAQGTNSSPTPDMALMNIADQEAFIGSPAHLMNLADGLQLGGIKISSTSWFPQMVAATGVHAGLPRALPLALSLPVLYYNRDAFRKAGLNPDQPPRTWGEVQAVADKFYDQGVQCPLTSSHFSWIHLENAASVSGEPAIEAKTGRLTLNSLTNLKHLALVSTWQKSTFFRYVGAGAQGDVYFARGTCLMNTSASGAQDWISRNAKFSVGIAPLPYAEDAYAPGSGKLLPDGASLWLLAGRPAPAYKVMARFVHFLTQTATQQAWVQATGYLPLSPTAMDALTAAHSPVLMSAARNTLIMGGAPLTTNLSAVHPKLRTLIAQQVELVWERVIQPKQALDTMTQQGNLLLANQNTTRAKPAKVKPVRSAHKKG